MTKPLSKSMAFMPRKPGTTRARFRRYYEERHSPLALEFFTFDRYVRNHLDEADDIGDFDCYSEFWIADRDAIPRLMAGEAGDTMRRDERNFTDQPRIRAGLAEAHHLFGPPRTDTEDGTGRLLLLLSGTDRAGLLAALRPPAGATRMAVDFLTPFDPAQSFPADAVLSLWPATAAAPDLPPGWTVTGRFRATSAETVRPFDPNGPPDF